MSDKEYPSYLFNEKSYREFRESVKTYNVQQEQGDNKMTNKEIRTRLFNNDCDTYSAEGDFEKAMNEARLDERSKVIGEIETWVLGEKRPVDNYILAKLNEMKNVLIQKT